MRGKAVVPYDTNLLFLTFKEIHCHQPMPYHWIQKTRNSQKGDSGGHLIKSSRGISRLINESKHFHHVLLVGFIIFFFLKNIMMANVCIKTTIQKMRTK